MMLYTNGLFLTLRNQVVYNHLVVVRQYDSPSKITSWSGL